MPLQLTLANGKVYPQQGRILFADRQVNTQTGTIQIVGAFPNPQQHSSSRAVRAHARDDWMDENALLVPQRAVTELQGRYQVAVVGSDNKITIKDIQVGNQIGEMWIITQGLKAGDRVVSEGTSKVRNGEAVNPQPDTTKAESPYSEGQQ